MSEFREWRYSPVESAFLAESCRAGSYAGEKIATLEVENIYDLGKLVTLRFLEWVLSNPRGVVALPTGRTPEFFIKTMELYKHNWSSPKIQEEVKRYNFPSLQGGAFPDTTNLTFVMLDEFFPMMPSHKNSFCHYISVFYTSILGVKEENTMKFDLLANNVLTEAEMLEFAKIDVDLSLLTQTSPQTADGVRRKAILEKVKAFCESYESKIAELGGIGFFLGGIGPDGHIAFNQEGCAHDSPTRLVGFNYPSAAAAAGDLGGIEIARGKAAMTIGLKTITAKPDATIIIMAAGEGKATVVREAIEESCDVARPASVLHAHSGARMYLTHGAAMKLTARKAEKISQLSESILDFASAGKSAESSTVFSTAPAPSDYQLAESILVEASLANKVKLTDLTATHFQLFPKIADALPAWFTDPSNLASLCACADTRMKAKIAQGLSGSQCRGRSIVHTAPHHDDIMLSYHAAMHSMLGRPENRQHSAALGEKVNGNKNYFAYLTSGFHSVNDCFLRKHVDSMRGDKGDYSPLRALVNRGEVDKNYDALMTEFYQAFEAKDAAREHAIETVIFARSVGSVWSVPADLPNRVEKLVEKVEWIRSEYLEKHKPGDSVPKEMQLLKGAMRESEVDRVWALSRMPMDRVYHLRSKFYTDDFFAPMPTAEHDAKPMAELLKQCQPHVISVAFDPEGTGPDTHYKVLQIVAASLRMAIDNGDLVEEPDPIVWGYRNVWFVFTPSDATIFVPGSGADLDLMHDTFMSCFTTQKDASFPSPHYDGPFSAWARQIQKDQRRQLGVLLGEDWFANHESEEVRSCDGFILLKAMRASWFLSEVEDLRSKFEITNR